MTSVGIRLGSRYFRKTCLVAQYQVRKREYKLRKYLLGDNGREIGDDAGEVGNCGEGEAEFVEDVGGSTKDVPWVVLARRFY